MHANLHSQQPAPASWTRKHQPAQVTSHALSSLEFQSLKCDHHKTLVFKCINTSLDSTVNRERC